MPIRGLFALLYRSHAFDPVNWRTVPPTIHFSFRVKAQLRPNFLFMETERSRQSKNSHAHHPWGSTYLKKTRLEFFRSLGLKMQVFLCIGVATFNQSRFLLYKTVPSKSKPVLPARILLKTTKVHKWALILSTRCHPSSQAGQAKPWAVRKRQRQAPTRRPTDKNFLCILKEWCIQLFHKLQHQLTQVLFPSRLFHPSKNLKKPPQVPCLPAFWIPIQAHWPLATST